MLRRLFPTLLAAVWLVPSVANAQLPEFGYNIAPSGKFEFDWGAANSPRTAAAGPALIVLTGGPRGSMFASGVGGDLWSASDSDLKFEAGPLVDTQVCLAMAADGQRLVTAGLGANVRVWILPSERLGTIQTPKTRGIAGDGATQRIATLQNDSVLVRKRGQEGIEATLPVSKIAALTSGDIPEFVTLAWLSAPHDGSPYVLAGSDAGHIAGWTASSWAADPMVLKAIAPDSGSDEEMPAIKCIVQAGPHQFVTGDANGHVRRWRLPRNAAVGSVDLPPGTPAAPCEDGLHAVMFNAGKFALHNATSSENARSIATDRTDAPEFMIHRRLALTPSDGANVDEILSVWPATPPVPAPDTDALPADATAAENESAAPKHLVRIYVFPSVASTGPASEAQPRLTGIVTGTLRAVAVHPADATLAVATSEVGTQFIHLSTSLPDSSAEPASDATANPPVDDAGEEEAPTLAEEAYVALHYSSDGKRLFEVVSENGSTRISRYDAHDPNSRLSGVELAVTATASAPYGAATDADSNSESFLFLGTDNGKLLLVQFALDPATPAVAKTEIVATAETPAGEQANAIHARGNRVVVVANETAWILQVAASEPKLRFLEQQTTRPAKGVRLAENDPSFVVVGETVSSRPTYALAVSDALGESVEFLSADNSGALYGALKNGVVLDLQSAPPRKLQDAGDPQITALAVSPDGNHLLAGTKVATGHHIRHWSLSGSPPSPTDSQDTKHRITSLVIPADSTTFFAGCEDGNAAQFAMGSIEQLKLKAILADRTLTNGAVTGFAALPPMPPRNATSETPDQAALRLARIDRVFVAHSSDVTSVWTLRAVEGFRLLPGKELPADALDPAPGSYGSPYFSVVENAKLRRIAAAGSDGFVRVWQQPGSIALNKYFSPNGTLLKPDVLKPVSRVPLYAVALLASQETPAAGQPAFAVFAGGADGNIYRAAGDELHQAAAFEPPAMVYSLAAHPTKPFLAAGAGARTPIKTLAEPAGARAAGDKTIRIWTYALDPMKFVDCNGHAASIASLAFSPLGELLASVDASGKVLVWDCRDLDVGALPTSIPSMELSLPSAGRTVEWRRSSDAANIRLSVGCANGEVYVFAATPK